MRSNHRMALANSILDCRAEDRLLGDDQPGAYLRALRRGPRQRSEVNEVIEVTGAGGALGHIDGELVRVVEPRLPWMVLDLQVERHRARHEDGLQIGWVLPATEVRVRAAPPKGCRQSPCPPSPIVAEQQDTIAAPSHIDFDHVAYGSGRNEPIECVVRVLQSEPAVTDTQGYRQR